MQNKRVYKHYLDPSTLPHPIYITVVGIGATGSEFCRSLARMCHILKVTENRQINVTLYDGDTIEENNIGKQMYSIHDQGHNKAEVMAYRINTFYGLNWVAVPHYFGAESQFYQGNQSLHIYVGAVDSWRTRILINKVFEKSGSNLYYLDMGNDRFTGQAIIGAKSFAQKPKDHVMLLPTIIDLFPDYVPETENEEPSCSVIESIHRQDLMINPMIANLGANLIWNLLFRKVIVTHGYFLNLNSTMLTERNVEPWERPAKPKKAKSKKLVDIL